MRRPISRDARSLRAAGNCLLLAAAPCLSCGGAETVPLTEDPRPRVDSAELTTFEIRSDEVDRFEHCPPPGEIGQEWLPPIPEWRPASASPQAEPGAAPPAEPGDTRLPASARELVDEAQRVTHAPFRRCYLRGLRFDPTQDGHVAIVLRVGAAGKVDAVESWGGCDLAPESIACMRDEARDLVLRPPAAGYATVVVPSVFTEGNRRHRASTDAYTAAAYVAVETERSRFHACLKAATQDRPSLYAYAKMTIDVDAEGRTSHVSVDAWKGSQPLLACAADVLNEAKYPPARSGHGHIVVPILFNLRLAE
jgi:hypothetical protein